MDKAFLQNRAKYLRKVYNETPSHGNARLIAINKEKLIRHYGQEAWDEVERGTKWKARSGTS